MDLFSPIATRDNANGQMQWPVMAGIVPAMGMRRKRDEIGDRALGARRS
jgi:hypothetical protein